MTERDPIRPECEAYFEEGKSRMKSIDDKVNRILHWIDGNGQPGVKVRLDRLERAQRTTNRLVWYAVAATVSAVVMMVVRG